MTSRVIRRCRPYLRLIDRPVAHLVSCVQRDRREAIRTTGDDDHQSEWNDMREPIDQDRRRLLGRAAMTIAVAHAAADAGPSERKVVLVDFRTYTCINWLGTLPYVRAWQR